MIFQMLLWKIAIIPSLLCGKYLLCVCTVPYNFENKGYLPLLVVVLKYFVDIRVNHEIQFSDYFFFIILIMLCNNSPIQCHRQQTKWKMKVGTLLHKIMWTWRVEVHSSKLSVSFAVDKMLIYNQIYDALDNIITFVWFLCQVFNSKCSDIVISQIYVMYVWNWALFVLAGVKSIL